LQIPDTDFQNICCASFLTARGITGKPVAMTQRRRIRPRIYATRQRPANPTTNLRLQGIAAALGNLAGA
jgi:hypothetical protein